MRNDKESYTDIAGEVVQVDELSWLEDGMYLDDAGNKQTCSRYYVGEIDGDSQSVWLNDDMEEVEPV